MKRNMASGQGTMYSIFSGGKLKQSDITAITNYANAMKGGANSAQAWSTGMNGASVAAKQYVLDATKAGKSTDEMVAGLKDVPKATTAASAGLKALSVAGNMLLMMGISMAIGAIIKGFQTLANAQENAIEKADEFIGKFEEQRDALKSNKEAIDSMSADYEKLAKGVDSLGRNVSLNSDEYARYNEIVNKIADMFPQMVQGYTDEGNAIIVHKGNVEELTKAYKEQKKAAQDAIIVGSADVFAGFKAATDKDPEWIWEESGLLQMKELVDKIVATGGDVEKIQEVINGLGGNSLVIGDVFDKIGLDKGWFDWNTLDAEYISENIKKFQSLFNTLNTEIDAQAAKIKPIMQAYLEQSDKFQLADEKVQDMVKQIVGQFDAEFYSQFDSETQMASWVEENVIDKLRGNKDLVNDFRVMFDLQTKFNKGDITVTEYQEKLTAFLSLIDTLPDETQKAIKLLFGITTNDDGTTSSDVDTMVANVKEKFKGKFEKEIGQLKLDELEILTNLDISPDGIKDWSEVETLIANAGKEVNKMTVSLSELGNVSDKIKTVSDAFKEFSDNGHLSIETIGELKTATGLSDEEFKKYKDTLLSAKVGSSEFNQIMSEMTFKILDNTFTTEGLVNATEDEIAAVLRENGVTNASTVAHYAKQVAVQKDKIATAELEGATEDEIKAILEECETLGLDIGYFYAAIEEKIRYNATHIENSDDIESLLNECKAVGALTGYYKNLGLAKSFSEDYKKQVENGKYSGRINPETQQVMTYNEAFNYASANGIKVSDLLYFDPTSLSNINLDDVNVDIPKIDVPTVNYDPDSSKSGSDSTPDYEDPTDAIINRINLRADELAQQEEEIQNLIEIAELENDYKKQISLTNDLIAKRKDKLAELETANAGLHNEAEWLRNSTPQWNEEEWFDSQGNATKSYIDFINGRIKAGADKEEIDAIKDQFEAISKYKKAYMDNAEEITGINKQILQDEEKIWDLRREEFDNRLEESEYYIQHSKDFGWENGDNEIKARKRVLDWIQSDYYKSLIKDDEEYYKILEEHRLNYLEAQRDEFEKATDFASSYLDSRKTLLQSYYDVTNSIAEAQHEINKELETSKTMYEWLDEDTRKLLFNQEDYNTLSKELIDIQSEADRLQRQYEYDLRNSTLETVESITSQYQMQYETLMKSYEIAKADLDIAKKKQKLNNILNERNVRMRIDGQWQWVANTEDVANAKAELADAEYAKRVAESGLTQQNSINELTKRQDELGVVIKKFEGGVIDLGEAVTLAKNAIGSLPYALSSMYSNVGSLSSANSSSSGNYKNTKSYNGTSYDPNVDYSAEMKNYEKGSAKWNLLNKRRNAKIAGEGLSYDPFASGTRCTPSGNVLIGEKEPEIFIDNNGHFIPINQPTFANIGAGGVVFNQNQLSNLRSLWDLSNIGTMPTHNISNITSRQISETNTYQMYGNMVFDGNNPEEVFKQFCDFMKHNRYKSK